MKNVKVILLSVLFCSTFFMASAKNLINPEKAVEQLQTQISEMIVNAEIWSAEDAGTTLKLKFMITNENEVLVLSTNSESHDAAIKELLNYVSVNTEVSLQNQVFILPVRLEE